MTPGGTSAGADRLRPPDPLWLPAREADPVVVRALMQELRLPEPICAVIAVRGIVNPEDAKTFLRPRLEHLHDPSLLTDAQPAAERIRVAIDREETVLVHGDYDVDGICGSALLSRWLRSVGAKVVPFVPHRVRDGYDLSDAGLARAEAVGATLIVTVDCGTVAHGAIERAGAAGIDVVVTDHHRVAGELPGAVAVVNPNRPDCAYPDKGLCGAGVAFKLGQLVARSLGRDEGALTDYLDLVALATVADLVPLRGENRVLVRYGLRRFANSRVIGIDALLTASGVEPAEVDTGKLGFALAPRINAAGRIGDSSDALRLLVTDDPAEARTLAARLDETNRQRREVDRRTLEEAVAQLESRYQPDSDFGLVLAGEGWHPGVVGIVASRLVERVHRPVLLIALDGSSGRGSGRSIPGFDLYEALQECAAHMVRFGGHSQAAGMDVTRDDVPALREAFNRVARARLEGTDLRPTLHPDVEVALEDANLDLAHWLSYLAPHGIGNPRPVFLSRRVAVEAPRVVGENHLKVQLADGSARVDGIGFGLTERHPPASLGSDPHDVLFRLERNQWRGSTKAQARLLDLRPSGSAS